MKSGQRLSGWSASKYNSAKTSGQSSENRSDDD